MRILVMCAAGASSTFVAQRLTRAAAARGRSLDARAGTESSLDSLSGGLDLVLLGSHLEADFDRIAGTVRALGARPALLPADVIADRDGAKTLAFVDDLVASPGDSQ